MRAVERLLCRAKVPLRYSQGFNPRPALSLVLPRPVGVASRADLLVLSLDEPMEQDELLRRIAQQCPPGLQPLTAYVLEPGKKPRVKEARYELPLRGEQVTAVGHRVAELQNSQDWTIQRQNAGEPENRAVTTMDLRPLVKELSLQGPMLVMVLSPRGDSWARPSEMLRLLGLDERVDLAQLVRTGVDYSL